MLSERRPKLSDRLKMAAFYPFLDVFLSNLSVSMVSRASFVPKDPAQPLSQDCSRGSRVLSQ